jgi:hypothetical protein
LVPNAQAILFRFAIIKQFLLVTAYVDIDRQDSCGPTTTQLAHFNGHFQVEHCLAAHDASVDYDLGLEKLFL